jgi:UDP-2,3-diacylglucosamine hydrolase
MTTLFISDLHLYHQRPAVTEAFRQFLRQEAVQADSLYILGDLFEAWIGDDDPDPNNRSIVAALKELTDSGTRCFFIGGNRDFLVGDRFAEETGVNILSDGTQIDLYNQPVLLMHGDTLCTDDKEYQRFRRFVHHPATQAVFLTLPVAARRALAKRKRDQSMSPSSPKPEEIMDVNQAAVEKTMRDESVKILVHGHTHRPAAHRFKLAGNDAQRIVLGDWYSQGSILRWDSAGPELTTLDYR